MIVNEPKPFQGKQLQDDADFLHIGTNFKVVGTVTGGGLCVVNGVVEGKIESEAVKLNIASSLLGEVDCKRLDLAGAIQGNVHTHDALLRSTAVLIGTIHYRLLLWKKAQLLMVI